MSKIIGGSAFGRGDSIVDTTDAVLLAETAVVMMAAVRTGGVENVIGLELAGRVNHSHERSEVLYLLDSDGAAVIISELIGIASRMDPRFLEQLLRRVKDVPK